MCCFQLCASYDTDLSVSTTLKIPSIICAASRFDSAVTILYEDLQCVQKVKRLMAHLESKENLEGLAKHTTYTPLLSKDDDDWLGTLAMLERFVFMIDSLKRAAGNGDVEMIQLIEYASGKTETLDYMLDDSDICIVANLFDRMRPLRAVHKGIRNVDQPAIGMLKANQVFSKLIDKYPEFSSELNANSLYLQNPAFENSIIKAMYKSPLNQSEEVLIQKLKTANASQSPLM